MNKRTPPATVTRSVRPRARNNAPLQAVLSLHTPLTKAVIQFLCEEGMTCPRTKDGLVTLINALRHYTEEGQALFPEVFVLDSLRDVLQLLPESESVAIGEGIKDAATMAKALKKCAPLARRGWAVYIERDQRTFKYGLFRTGSGILSLTPAELLVNRGDSRVPVLMLRQVAENVIEVRGVSQTSLLVQFGGNKESEISPVPALTKLVASLTAEISDDVREQASTFYRTVFSGILRASHGTLIAVMPGGRRAVPSRFRDGIALSPPISVASKVRDALTFSDRNSNAKLQACAALVTGMLLSDGITLFGTDGTVRAYNIFIKHPRRSSTVTGGARARTFEVIAGRLGHELKGVFIQSQDGRVEFRGDSNE